ncbi:lipopolysaccharide transport periplasmic protein LptA [Stenotrophomonas maltophilia]|uniref:lipopolysaccharide transport periplasmic protein LptA n=1 Tax=Stenotrophomonas maltophilia group TaxID=995085 RepID=UPI000D446D30|nr:MULTISPECIES: lipopolysaccharide transport periplasmic protein LptA [Stenotrophomonas maltophilia group]MCF3495327.1 lipopolysaccharide transport periplasmic protein LptA [Stenotrophomonas maltophilia]MDQ4680104.1 lipopolysaccharide transport periplasmic protein LptA [Stenotrophomonas maltophilia group sp. RNC7]PSD15705.1 lipopolysaccharide transport periplasmic protein LptA [Stenotrophomonas maltophilia]UGB22664.1 lipopolysaccharide transport periplasmic protein LptA [Stenotrophomonas malto
MKIPFAAVLALGLLVPSAGFAKSTDRNENMNIDSGAQSGVLTGDGKTVLSQGVTVTQGTLDIRASEAEIYLKDGEAVRAVFTGKQATMKQQLDDGTWMDAVADRIDYDIKTEIITLTGSYKVTSARGTNAGQRMVYNTRTGEMNSGGDGSRVRTVIPPKNKNAAAQPAAAPKAAAPASAPARPAGSKK